MKTNIKIISFVLMLCLGTFIIPQKASAQEASVNFQVFYNNLSPYGTWVDNPQYGYVWYPDVPNGFEPYVTDGHWVLTSYGWTWVSDYPWGWAAFHYGRWFDDPTYGEMWVPDNVWGPGWVTWRRSAGYYGWAPIGPGISLSLAYSSGYHLPNDRWTFVGYKDFGRPDISNYYIRSSNNGNIFRNSIMINNSREDKSSHSSYNSGPSRSDVEKSTGKTFTPIAIKESSKPGKSLSSNQLQIYKPNVTKNNTSGRKPAPAKVANRKDIKTKSQAAANKQSTVNTKRSAAVNKQESKLQNARQDKKQPVVKDKQSGTKQIKSQPQQRSQQIRQQPKEQPREAQPARQQPKEQPRAAQPARQQPKEQPRAVQPARQQQAQPQQHSEPPKEQQSAPGQNTEPRR